MNQHFLYFSLYFSSFLAWCGLNMLLLLLFVGFVLSPPPPPPDAVFWVRHILVECNHLSETRLGIFGRRDARKSFYHFTKSASVLQHLIEIRLLILFCTALLQYALYHYTFWICSVYLAWDTNRTACHPAAVHYPWRGVVPLHSVTHSKSTLTNQNVIWFIRMYIRCLN